MTAHVDVQKGRIHGVPDAEYADIAARDADTVFNTDVKNIDKEVRVNTVPVSYWMLAAVGPFDWVELSNTASTSFLDPTDTPASYSGQAGKITQVNTAENALEFGQDLRPTGNPTFKDLILSGKVNALNLSP